MLLSASCRRIFSSARTAASLGRGSCPRSWAARAAELVSGSEEPAEEPATDVTEVAPEAEAETEVEEVEVEELEVEELAAESTEPDAEPEEIEYSLFVPGPNGYELLPQTGVPPHAGQTVELILPEQKEPTVFEVVRSGRALPDGDVCVYLAQV